MKKMIASVVTLLLMPLMALATETQTLDWTGSCDGGIPYQGCVTYDGTSIHISAGEGVGGRIHLIFSGAGTLTFKARGSYDGFFYSDQNGRGGGYIRNSESFTEYSYVATDAGEHRVLWATYAKGYIVANAWGEICDVKWNGNPVKYNSLVNGLVARYDCDGNLNDASGNEHGLKISGVASYIEDRYGKFGSAFELDGSTCLYETSTDDKTCWESNYTFSCWFKACEETRLYDVKSSGIYGTGTSIKYLCGDTDYPIAIGTNGINIFEHANSFLPAVFKYESDLGSVWHHIAFTVSENHDAIVYLDGKQVGSFEKLRPDYCAQLRLGGGSLPMGIAAFLYGGHFKGGVDDIRFYNRSLSADEVTSLYGSTHDIGLVAWYKFDGDAKDSSGHGNNLANNGATAVADRFGCANSALHFEGDARAYAPNDNIILATNSGTIAGWFMAEKTIDRFYSESISGTYYDAPYAYSPISGGDLSEQYWTYAGVGFALGSNGLMVYEHTGLYLPTPLVYQGDIGNGWNHICITYQDNGAEQLYINGCFIKSGLTSSKIKVLGFRGGDTRTGIGGGEYGHFTGSADDVRFYNRALSAAEVKALYEFRKDRPIWNVAFNTMGGVAGVDTMSVTNGMAIGELPTAERSCHKFLGWFTEKCEGTRITSETIITNNVTFYAHWFDTSIGNVTGATNVLWRTGGDAVWATEEAEDGWDVRSGVIGKNSETWVECVVTNGCRVAFDWKASCEPDDEGEMYDYLSFTIDSEDVAAICGETDWTNSVFAVAGEGEHVLRWTYQKDYRTSEGEDCGWLGMVKIDLEVPVVFDDNDATSGEVPTIATAYLGDIIVIPGTGTLAKSYHTFGGWKYGEMVYDESASFAISNNEVTFTAVWSAKQLGPVTLATPETSHVTTEKIGISFNIPENATTIRYTIDGSDPTIDSPIYTGPFEIGSKSVTVKAIAYAEDWFDSACATWELTRAPWSASECLNIETRTFSYTGNADWVRDLDTTHDGEAAMRSGAIDDKQKSTIQMLVTGSGTVSFWCKVSSECDPDDGSVYDGLSVFVDGNEVFDDLIGGDVDWTNITVAVSGDGEHTIAWRYEKDKTGSAGADCAWLDELLWQADQTVVTAAETGGKDVVIGREWIEKDLVKRYGAGKTELFRNKYGTDYDLAVRKLSGKAVNGKPACVWQDYVAGTDPTDTNSIFTASIDVVDGVPVVTWDPDLKTKRSYSVWGREELSGTNGWVCPTNSAHHFFKVSVEMP